MKPVDSLVFQKIKAIIEGDNDKNKDFKMGIIVEVALDKFLMVP